MNPVKLIIVGAGSCGTPYAQYAEHHPDQAQVVGVADPSPFLRNQIAETHHIPAENVFDLSGYGGGDYHLMKQFVAALASQDQEIILSGPRESLESHLIVFAAEKARRRGTVEFIDEYLQVLG